MTVPIPPPIYPGPPPLFPVSTKGTPGNSGFSLPLVNGDINIDESVLPLVNGDLNSPGGGLDDYPGIVTSADGQMIAVPIAVGDLYPGIVMTADGQMIAVPI